MSTCSICLQVPDKPTIVLPCQHQFCHLCITRWNSTKNSCPCCRRTMRKFKSVRRVSDFQNAPTQIRRVLAAVLVIVLLSCLSYLAVEFLSTNQQEKPETELALYTNKTSSPGLLDYFLYPFTCLLRVCCIMTDFLLTTVYFINVPFYYTGWVIWCCIHFHFWVFYTLVTYIFSLFAFVFNWLWYTAGSLYNFVAVFPIKQLLQPSLDFIFIVWYVLWESVTDVVYAVCGLLAIPISLIKNTIVFIFFTLCIIIYKLVTNVISLVVVLVLSVTDVGLAILPVAMFCLLMFVAAVSVLYVVDRL